jgi:hypothetical protein
LIVALSKHLERCSVQSLALRVEYGSTLVRARTLCWLACIQSVSFGPLVRWLRSWSARMFTEDVLGQGVRLAATVVDDLVQSAMEHEHTGLQEEIERILRPVV